MNNDVASLHFKKMTETPIPKLITLLAIPTIISMLVSNIYNLVDTYFVGKLGVSASGAIGVIFTLMAILQAIGFMLGHGSGSVISRLLAKKEIDKASEYASTSFFLSLFIGVVFVVFGLIFIEPLVYFLGSTVTILPYAKTYAFYIILGAPFFMSSLVMNNILRYEGKAFYSMIGLALGSILNMILDPIFIFGFNMGMHGAGLATAFGQFVSFIVLLVLFKKNAQSKFNFKVMSKEFNTYFTIFKTGLPSLIRQGLNSISSGLLNNIAKPFGDECISALSIVSRINMFLLSVGLGMGQGYQPVAGFNYQARKYNRVREGFKFTLITSVVMMGTFCLFAMIFSEQFVSLFIDDSKVIDIAKVALRFTVIALLAMPLSTVGNMLFQSIGKNLVASFLSCLRAGLCYIPLIIILSMTLGLLGIQMTQMVSDILTSLITLPFIIHFFRNLPKEDNNDEILQM